MKLAYLLASAALTVALPLAAQQTPDQDGRYLIQFRDFRGAAQVVRAAGGTPVVELAQQGAIAAYLPSQALPGLRKNPNVVLIEPDPRRHLMAETSPYGIAMVQADQVSDANAANTTVCIIDSGYFREHEDLSAGPNVTGSTDPGTGNWYEDSCGHGTHVAGTVAALKNNNLGVVGVLPSGTVKLRAEKVFDGSACAFTYSSNLIAALNSCRNNTPSSQRLVVSMSLGGSFSSVTESNAFQSAYDAGVLSIAAAGNAGNRTKSYPASYPSVVSVAAVDSSKNVASFSQQNNQVELAAPGVAVLSTVPFAPSSVTAAGVSYSGENIEGSARINASGTLVDGGLCSTTGVWSGQVVLCQRGVDSFATKVANVRNGGGVAAVIYNNVSGGFAGTLNGSSTIPAISISLEDGAALKASALGSLAQVANTGGVGSGYSLFDGTSMATPHVSGVAALVWSNVSGRTNADIRAALQATAEDRGAAGRDNAYGYGIVRARAALDHLAGGTPPPSNTAPVASFAFSCDGLACSFTDQSTDSDGTVAAWSWNFGDTGASTEQNPSHTYAAGGTYVVTLTVTDDDAATSTTTASVTVSAASAGLTLSATGFKVKGVNTASLVWNGAAGTDVNIHRNGVLIATRPSSDGAYTDSTGTKGGATFTYRVCEASSPSTCSNEVQVAF